jgi:hypothetical protein
MAWAAVNKVLWNNFLITYVVRTTLLDSNRPRKGYHLWRHWKLVFIITLLYSFTW